MYRARMINFHAALAVQKQGKSFTTRHRRKGRRGVSLLGNNKKQKTVDLFSKEPGMRSDLECSFISTFIESKKEFKNFVKSFSIDEELREIHLMDFAQHVQYMKLPKNHAVFYQHEVAHSWFFVLSGNCNVYVYVEDHHKDKEGGSQEQVEDPRKKKKNGTVVPTRPASKKRVPSWKQKKVSPEQAKRKSPPPAINHDFIKKHAKGETKHLFRPIDPLPKFVPNIDRLHPLRNPLGDQVAQLEPGESFGQLALLNKRRRAATVISEEVELLVLDKPDYDRIIRPIHEGKNKYDYMLHFMRQMHCFKTLAPKQLMSLAVSVSIHKLNPREALFEQNEKVRYLYIVISGSLLLSNRKKSGKEKNHMVSERHEIEICPALTMVAVRHTFDVKTIPRFEYRCSAGEEGGVILTLPMALVREVYNPTAMLLSKGLEASFKILKNYAENRTKWHEVRLEFCKNYADL